MLQEQNKNAFYIKFQDAINHLSSDEETVDFANYFIGAYANCIVSWAYCYRVHAGINTNVHVERMHHTLKHIYLQGKKMKRLDKSLHALMRYIRDKSIDRLVVLHKGKISFKIKELHKRHNTSLLLSQQSILENEDNNSWNVLSENVNKLYRVNKLEVNCNCQIICEDCHTCIHSYSCSCIDSAIKWNICRHIHLICQFFKNKNKTNIISSQDVND